MLGAQMPLTDTFVTLEDPRWDSLISDSTNGCFLHSGRFLGYHGQRFPEKILLLHEESGAPVAGIRFVVDGTAARSHPGSTYGGLIYRRDLGAKNVVFATEHLLQSLAGTGIRTLTCRPLPSSFRDVPDESDLYAIHQAGGRVIRRDLSTVCPTSGGPGLHMNRVRRVVKAKRSGVRITEAPDVEAFHQILVENLRRHSTQPVHSASEMRALMGLFPDRIGLHCAEVGGEMIAGILLFHLGNATHTQYLASTESGRELGALDFLVHNLLDEGTPRSGLLSLGISTENEGRLLNEGLVRFKESFGGYSQMIDTYEISL